jgi:addiction module HigA family antidote
MTNRPASHPGEILRDEFIRPLGISVHELAASCHVSNTDIERLVREQIPVTAQAAQGLSNYFGTSPEFWLDLQTRYDLERTSPAFFSDTDIPGYGEAA